MTLSEAMELVPPKRCKFGQLIVDMPDDDRRQITALLAEPVEEVGNTYLKRLLRAADYEVADRTFRRHRQRLCICYGIQQKDYTK